MKVNKELKIISFLLLISLITKAQIQKVEPPFWYAGMLNPEVQILFYGKNIAENDISASNKIVIKEIKKTDNQNYLFVTIDTKDIPAQEFVFTFSKNKKIVFTQKYALRQRKENSSQRKSFDASDVIYLIMPDRFANGNPNNDSEPSVIEKADRALPNGRHGGDIEGIIQHLDYIKELGATAIWPTPLCEDNLSSFTYHGYAQTDLYKIDPRFGTNEDYLRLSAELHKRNMKLVMDYVTNHWGTGHWLLKDMPTTGWVHQFPAYTQSNYRLTTQVDPNTSIREKQRSMNGWFDTAMADLDQSNPLVLTYLIQNAIWWIESADLDGMRVDTYPYNDKAGIAAWTKAITNEYPNLNIVGEIWMNDQAQIAYWQKDSRIGAIQNYNSYLPSVMDFPLMESLGTAFLQDQGLNKVYESFTNDFLFANTNTIMVFAENHDTRRINELYKSDVKKYQMVMTLIATVRGIPQLYYGSEIGMRENKNPGHAALRQDFPGGWNSDPNNAFTKAGRTAEQEQFFDFASRLFNWRRTNEALHFGKMTHYIPENNVYVYFRSTDKKTVMVVINNASGIQTLKPIRFEENIKTFTSGKDVLSGKSVDLKNDFTIEGQSVLILELE